MALTTTTLASACALLDKTISVTSATSFVAGARLIVDSNEVMFITKDYVSGTIIPVLRGQQGTKQQTHPITCNVTLVPAGDDRDYTAGSDAAPPLYLTKSDISYTATGAITVGTADFNRVRLNGTSVCAMTLAHPLKDQDGILVQIVGNGKAAHTVTFPTGGIGNAGAGYTVATFDASGCCNMLLVASNGFWQSTPSPLSGTLTAIDVAIA